MHKKRIGDNTQFQKLSVYTLSVWKCVYESDKKNSIWKSSPKKKKRNENTGAGILTTILSDKIFDEHLKWGEHELICIHFESTDMAVTAAVIAP